jgi:uncharacterized protein (PEP-CTERM system associated)
VSSSVATVAAGVVVGTAFPGAAQAQLVPDFVGAYSTPWRYSAGLEVDETWSDNINLQPSGSQRSDFVTTINPSFEASRTSRRLNLSLQYSPQLVYYARGSNGTQLRNGLGANANATVIDNLLFVNASAGISQQNISPFGTQAANTYNGSNNRAESRNYSFGPTLRSRLGQDLTYSLGYNYAVSSSDSSAIASSHSTDVFANFQTSTSFRDLGYGMNFDRSEQDYGGVNTVTVEQGSGTLTYVLLPTLHLSGSAGYERDHYPTVGQPDLKSATYSGGFDWEPTRHTSFSAQFGHRYFGPTANVHLTETMSRFSVSASYSRDQSTSGAAGLTLVQDPNYQLLDQYYRTTITDPVARAQLVTAALQAAGLPSSQFATSNFLSNQIYVQTRADLSVALVGLRNTVSFDVSRSQSQGLSNLTVGFDIFNQTSRFRTMSYSANWSYKLGPSTSVNATAQKVDSAAIEGVGSTRQRSLSASISRQISKKVSATALYRNTKQTGTGDSGGFYSGNYVENAVFGSLRVNF